MAVTITDADNYVSLNVIQADDWLGSESSRKQRLLNVAERELATSYPDYIIPDNAVYEFAAVLAVAFNDTNVQRQNGVASFSVAGMTFTFRGGRDSLATLVPKVALDLIGAANDVKLSKVRWTVM